MKGRRGICCLLLGAAVCQMSCAGTSRLTQWRRGTRTESVQVAAQAPDDRRNRLDAPEELASTEDRAGNRKRPDVGPEDIEVAASSDDDATDSITQQAVARSEALANGHQIDPCVASLSSPVVKASTEESPPEAVAVSEGAIAAQDPAVSSSEDDATVGQGLPAGIENEGAVLPELAHLSGDDVALRLGAAPIQNTDRPMPINLATALSLSDARPLVVASAQASAWVAEAQLQRAQVIWVPELTFGAAYMRHDGFGPDFGRGKNLPNFGNPGGGGPLNQNLNWFYGGGGLDSSFMLTDAIFTPLAARQVLTSKRWDIQAAKNDALLETANAYFGVHQARGQYAGILDAVDRGQKLVERIQHLSRDLVPTVEVDRAIRMLADIEQKAASAREEWRVASANLTEVLRLDPSVVVVPLEHDHMQITLVNPDQSLDDLIRIGLRNRPELASQYAMREAVAIRIRREKLRPFIPKIIVSGFQTPGGMNQQFGAFGTGRGSDFNNWSFRDDISTQLIWQAEGFGLGNYARVKEQRAEESRTVVKIFRLQDKISAEITQAQARVQAAAVRVVQAERSIREALITFEGNYEGLEQTKRFENVLIQVYRPQEAVAALEQLLIAYMEYFATVAEFNMAQFEMFHALGYPAREVADFHPPGEKVPVDLDRPFGLPYVGEGPPPADR